MAIAIEAFSQENLDKQTTLTKEAYDTKVAFIDSAIKADYSAEKEDPELDKQIEAMVDRWARSSKVELDKATICSEAKKMYYHRLANGTDRGFWNVLRDNVVAIAKKEAEAVKEL